MNTQLKSILAQRLAKKGKKANGFTLIELMVVVAIVGVLSAVGLPQLLKAQDRAKVSVAQQEAVNYAKECSISLLTGAPAPDGSQYDTLAVATAEANGKPASTGQTCAEDVDIIATAGGDVPVLDSDQAPITITVTLDGAIPGKPISSEA
jgi:type IV pilus assembly protein PilA